jgi:hypothetical protein
VIAPQSRPASSAFFLSEPTGREIEATGTKIDIGVKPPLGFIAFSGTLDMSKDALAKMVSQLARDLQKEDNVGARLGFDKIFSCGVNGRGREPKGLKYVVLQKNCHGGHLKLKDRLSHQGSPRRNSRQTSYVLRRNIRSLVESSSARIQVQSEHPR